MAPSRISKLWKQSPVEPAVSNECPTERSGPDSAGSQHWALPDSATGARTALIEASALWAVSRYGGAPFVIDAAATAVAHGVGGDRVVALASLYGDTDSRDFLQFLTSALAELGYPITASSDLSILLREAALSAMCRRFLTGAVTGPQLTRWAVRTFGYWDDGIAGELAYLEDGYEIYGDSDEVAILAREIAARQLAS